MNTEKIRENRVRRMAIRQGLNVVKSRRRDPRAYDFGGYMIVNPYNNSIVDGAHPHAFSLNLDEVEALLDDGLGERLAGRGAPVFPPEKRRT